MGKFVSHHRRLMILVALLLPLAAAAPARADSPFSIVFGLDQQRHPAFAIRAFGPSKGQKLLSIDSIDLSGRPPLYTEFKPPASSAAASQSVASTSKQSRAAALLRGTLSILRALLPHH
jgi:hypothetical protein